MDVEANIAQARVESCNGNGVGGSDMLLLFKEYAGWKIVIKLYCDHPWGWRARRDKGMDPPAPFLKRERKP